MLLLVPAVAAVNMTCLELYELSKDKYGSIQFVWKKWGKTGAYVSKGRLRKAKKQILAARFAQSCVPLEIVPAVSLGLAITILGIVLRYTLADRAIAYQFIAIGILLLLIPIAWYYIPAVNAYIHYGG